MQAPILTVTIAGAKLTISWSAVPDSEGYIFFYAPYPDLSYIGQNDVGPLNGPFTVELWDGAAFCIAVLAYNGSEYSDPSNIVHFVIDIPETTRGTDWVRNNPMFISGLTVSMGEPPVDFVDAYFDDFHATAAHLWADGLPLEADAWAAAEHPDFRFVSWLNNHGDSMENGELLGGYTPNAAGRIGYQIGDEPGLYCNDLQCAMNNIQEMEVGLDAVRVHDPEALIYLNFLLGIYSEELLEYYCEEMDGDIISYDHYSPKNSTYEALEIFRSAGLRHNKPYWRYLRSFYYQNDPDSISESDMRWNAFSGLVYGYTGHTWFIYNIDPNNELDPALFSLEDDFLSPTTNLWTIAAQINKEMQNLGRSITQLTSTDVRYIATISDLRPEATSKWRFGAGGDPYIDDIERTEDFSLLDILVGFFQDDAGEHY
ncbi:MAG: hypothetical protein GY850_18730, partial [bacterium]|nr:hypothetical protein [bacterium]